MPIRKVNATWRKASAEKTNLSWSFVWWAIKWTRIFFVIKLINGTLYPILNKWNACARPFERRNKRIEKWLEIRKTNFRNKQRRANSKPKQPISQPPTACKTRETSLSTQLLSRFLFATVCVSQGWSKHVRINLHISKRKVQSSIQHWK